MISRFTIVTSSQFLWSTFLKSNMLRTSARPVTACCQARFAAIRSQEGLRQAQQSASYRTSASETPASVSATTESTTENLPRALQALRLKPLRKEAAFGTPSCDLQLRSYSLQPLEFFADFALRAAYYLGLPAYGPIPLPQKIERWTVPRSHFIFKKSQENFERKTLRRQILIKDGHPETVQIWLAYLRKHQYYGIGMKANMWEFSELGVGKEMEKASKGTTEIDAAWSHLGQVSSIGTEAKVEELLASRRFREAAGLTEDPTVEGRPSVQAKAASKIS